MTRRLELPVKGLWVPSSILVKIMTLNHSLQGKSWTKDFADLCPKQIWKFLKIQILIASLSNFQCALNCFQCHCLSQGYYQKKAW